MNTSSLDHFAKPSVPSLKPRITRIHPTKVSKTRSDTYACHSKLEYQLLGVQTILRIDLAENNCICDVISLVIYLHCDFIKAPSKGILISLLFL